MAAIDPLTAGAVLLATAATDAVYVMFTSAVVARQRMLAATWSSVWYVLSSYAVISYTENWVYVAFAALGSWVGAYATITFLHRPPGGPPVGAAHGVDGWAELVGIGRARSNTHQRRCVWRWVSLRSTPTSYEKRLRDLAARSRPRFASWFALFEIRGRREDRVLAAPAVSRAICANKSAHEHTGQREHSGLPCARKSTGLKSRDESTKCGCGVHICVAIPVVY